MLNEYKEFINSFSYNGHNSLDFGLMVESTKNVHGNPTPVIDTVNIPGRGNLILNTKPDPLDNDEFSDFEKTYICHVCPEEGRNLEDLAREIYLWLYGKREYGRLEDTYEPMYYRNAYADEPMPISDISRQILGKIEISFKCRAFKMAKSGELVTTMYSEGSIYNMEGFTSKPYIKIYGSGDVSLYINDRMHAFKNIEEYLEIDSEILTAYKGNELQNNKAVSSIFPKLVAGKNNISWTGNVTKIEIIPRWCSL